MTLESVDRLQVLGNNLVSMQWQEEEHLCIVFWLKEPGTGADLYPYNQTEKTTRSTSEPFFGSGSTP